MIKYLPVLLLCCCLAACSSKTDQDAVKGYSENPTMTRDDSIAMLPLGEQMAIRKQDALASGIEVDSIILDHVFGMSRRQVIRHKNKLHRDKRIYPVYKTKSTRAFVYDLNLKSSGRLRTYFDTFYFNDELYLMECLPKIPKDQTPETIWEEAIDLFSLKYGDPAFYLPNETDEAPGGMAIWYQGNLRLEIDYDEDITRISYIDMIRENLKLQEI
ncbi:MAG: hypothetical protein AAFV80_04055 [Bacteroidota bacterium]